MLDLQNMVPKVSFKSREQRFMVTLRDYDRIKKEIYVGSFATEKEGMEAAFKVLSGVPIEDVRPARKMNKRNRSGVANICYRSRLNKYIVVAPRTGQYIAESSDLEEAKRILEEYKRTGKKPVRPNVVKGLHWKEEFNRWFAYGYKDRKKVCLGRFKDEEIELAEKAIEIYKATGERPFVKSRGGQKKIKQERLYAAETSPIHGRERKVEC